MKNTITLAIAFFILTFVAACGDDTAGTHTSATGTTPMACILDADCHCADDNDALCGDDGLCYCNTETTVIETEEVEVEVPVEVEVEVEVPNLCEADSDCDCPENTDATCNTEGLCLCHSTEIIEVPVMCQTETDCTDACPNGDTAACSEGLCICTETVIETVIETEVLTCTDVTDCSCTTGTASCEADGLCYCTEVIETTLICGIAEDCSCPTGTAACTNQLCHCTITEVVEVPNLCTDETECSCTDGTPSCLDGTCHCTIIEEVNRYVTITTDGPASTSVYADSNGVNLLSYDIWSSVDVTAKNTFVTIEIATPDGSVPNLPSVGEEYIELVSVVNRDNGATYAGPLSAWNVSYSVNANNTIGFSYLFTEDYDIAASQTGQYAILVNLGADIPEGYKVRASVQYSNGPGSASFFKDQGANVYLSAPSVNNPLVGEWMDIIPIPFAELTVSAASVPFSNTYVQGDPSVPALGISMTTADSSDITVKRITVRLYANSAAGTWGDAEGDTAADTVVSSVTLYDGNDVVAGPEGIDLFEVGGSSGYTAGTDYYVAYFDSLDMVIPAGNTSRLTARVSLLNTATGTNHLALDVDVTSVIAEDNNADTVAAYGTQLNGGTTKVPLITVLPNGSLTASAVGNPEGGIVVAGSSDVFVSNYRFEALDEDFQIQDLTIINDLNGAFNSPEATVAVQTVTIAYTDINGVVQTASSALVNGSAKFSGLDFYVPAGEDVYLAVLADTLTMQMVGPELSGTQFRLGLQDTGNSASTFEAIGQSSAINLSGIPVVGSQNVETFTVRKTRPYFDRVIIPTSLSNGFQELYELSVNTDQAGDVSFARLMWKVTTLDVDGGGELSVDNYFLYRNGVQLVDVGINLVPGVVAGTTFVVAGFTAEEVINGGGSANYTLRADISGVETNDAVMILLQADLPLTDNTRELVNSSGENTFWTGSNWYYTFVDEFNGVVWSDHSAEPHTHSTADGGSSADWSNGYQTGLEFLSPNVLSAN